MSWVKYTLGAIGCLGLGWAVGFLTSIYLLAPTEASKIKVRGYEQPALMIRSSSGNRTLLLPDGEDHFRRLDEVTNEQIEALRIKSEETRRNVFK